MKSAADDMSFAVLYGDTDSLFVNHVKNLEDAKKFTSECRSKLGVDVGHERTFTHLILVSKKHYIGIEPDLGKEQIIKGMGGLKSDRPEFIHTAFRQLVNDIKNGVNPIPKLRQSLLALDS